MNPQPFTTCVGSSARARSRLPAGPDVLQFDLPVLNIGFQLGALREGLLGRAETRATGG